MRILRSIPELAEVPGPIFLAIGVFDGVHLGHQAVIRRALADAQPAHGTAVAVTFDPHPARVLRPDKAPRLLTATGHKLQLIESLGIQHALVIRFSAEFAAIEPERFVLDLHSSAHPLQEICVGYEWCFGRNRAGDLAMLERMGGELGFEEIGVPAVRVEDEIVSSTLIRGALEAGDLARAARFLGRDYSILGTVVRGDGIGGILGFPTANLSAHSEQFPPNGVYAVRARHRARRLEGVVNIGVRPTVTGADGPRLLELHIFDFDESIYGEEVEIFFHQFLRAEQKFGSLADLKRQITRDSVEARTRLAERR